jgi:aminopeptidase
MKDQRVDRLAELIAGYSLGLREGQIFRIDGSTVASPLVVALYREALRRGAHAYLNVELDGIPEVLVAEGSDEQLTYISPIAWREVEYLDAWVRIWSNTNTRSFTRTDPARHQRFLATRRKLVTKAWERISAGEMRWCGTLFPTEAHAQDAEMSFTEYEDFVFRACHVLEGEDPVAYWQGTAALLAARADTLSTVRELRLLGPDTDLRLVVEGRRWHPADGKQNMPDGEIFTSPAETGTEGEIRFSFPAVFEGREMDDVRLRFEGGRVVAFEAARGETYLHALLEMDKGARVLGEVAFGLNYGIDRFTRNTLFDEKIGGTMHLALGSGFAHLGGRNESGLHLDIVCDLGKDGEVYADGELIWKAGEFVLDAQPAVTA